MKLLTKALENKLRANSAAVGAGADGGALYPVVKFFTPWGAATWLLTELDEDGRLFGLADLGMGSPELGYVMLEELADLKGPFGLKVERDLWFKANKTLDDYAALARDAGRVSA